MTVNGILALVDGDRFAANHVPLQQGDNIIVVRATDAAGHVQEATITLVADINGDFIRIDADPASGLDPFDTELTVRGSFAFSDHVLGAMGAGPMTFVDNDDGTTSAELTTPGLHYISAQVTDDLGTTHTDTVAVLGLDRQALDTLLQAKWSAMKARLTAGDIAGALDYHSRASRDDYEVIYTGLGDQLPQFVQEMQAIEMIYATDGFAKYRIRRDEIIQGQNYSITYYIYFGADESGVWRIDRY